MKLIDPDKILRYGFSEWLGCVLCGRATKEHPSCDGACDMQARLYADKAADALAIWLADVPTIDAEPVRHGHWVNAGHDEWNHYRRCSECGKVFSNSSKTNYCPNCGAKMDEVG